MSYSLSGSLLADGKLSATYSDRGRLKTITNPAGSTDTTTYFVNALGQRVKKSGPTTTIVTSGINYYVYDDAGHLLGEYNASGKPLQETVYLGDTPVAVLTQSIAGTAPSQVTSTNLHYVYADHLGTARVITRASDNKMVWRWDNADPFGMLPPDGNPSQLGAFTYNPRFPGQVYDRESGLFYNYFRDYDPSTGRYVESDPVGLKGGINTYGYVGGNPLNEIDPSGLIRVRPIPSGSLPSPSAPFFPPSWFQPSPLLPTWTLPDGFWDLINGPMQAAGSHPNLPIVKAGRDCNTGNCNPCPPGKEPYKEPNHTGRGAAGGHGSTTGFHWHRIIYNQKDDADCTCYPLGQDSPDGTNWK